MLGSLALAMRSSHVADFYATKYLAKPQQWLTSVLGPLINGFRRVREKTEAETKEGTAKPSIFTVALSKVRTAIFAANRSIWISGCEASLYLHTGDTAVKTHFCPQLHARRGLYMMRECKRNDPCCQVVAQSTTEAPLLPRAALPACSKLRCGCNWISGRIMCNDPCCQVVACCSEHRSLWLQLDLRAHHVQ